MIISYSKTQPFAEAIGKTFDGHHPCKLCKGIDKARRSAKKTESKSEIEKLNLLCARDWITIQPPALFDLTLCPDILLPTGSDAPPLPPPRA